MLAASSYDPELDAAHGPAAGLSIGLGVERLQDDFGLSLKLGSPRFLDDRLAIVLSAGVGWYPDLRALPMSVEEQDFSQWSLYGRARLCAEASVPIAFSAGRLYATAGPSVLLLSRQLSTTRVAIGGYGAVGAELFAGDAHRAFLFSIYAEIGATAHAASADVANRVGAPMMTEATVDRAIATGLAIGGGVRVYLWR
jgi:hypothetical protein